MPLEWRRRDSADVQVGPSVGEECEEFLAGHLTEYLTVVGRPIPGWAWLNRVAHVRRDELILLASGGFPTDPPAWRRALACLARAVLDQGEVDGGLDEIQRRLLIPLELQLIGEPGGNTLSPSQLIDRVLTELKGTTGDGECPGR